MAITLDGSVGITLPTSGDIFNASLIQSDTSSPPIIQNSSGTQIGTFCRAWVNFDGTGTVAIRAAFNVGSITDNGTGNYTANFTTAMTDTSYAVTAIANGQTSFLDVGAVRTGTRTTSAITLGVVNGGATAFVDANAVQVAIFR